MANHICIFCQTPLTGQSTPDGGGMLSVVSNETGTQSYCPRAEDHYHMCHCPKCHCGGTCQTHAWWAEVGSPNVTGKVVMTGMIIGGVLVDVVIDPAYLESQMEVPC